MVRRRKFIRIISYLTAVCVVFAIGGIFTSHAKTEYEETLEKVRFTSLVSLCEYCHYISSGLRLLAVSADDALAENSAFVCSKATAAQSSLSAFDTEKTKNISRFISGVYDFAESFSGVGNQRDYAKRLSEYAREIYYHLSDLSTGIVGGMYSLSEFGSVYFADEKPYFEDYLDYSNGKEKDIFSIVSPAAATKQSFFFLNGKEHISADSARKIASGYIKIYSSLWRESEADGDIEVYSFYHGDTAVELCKNGGILCRLVNPLPCHAAEFGVEDAVKKAEKFILKCGYKDCVAVETEKSKFTVSFIFVPRVNGILFLTAEIRAEVCLASGEITFFDASEFIKKYRTDIYADTEIPDFSDRLPPNLTMEKADICYADIGGKEQICYIAECIFEGEYVRAYIDYNTLRVLRIE